VELTDESFGRNYDTMGKGGRNADDINNKFSERQKEYETMNKPFMPTNPPVFSMQETTEISGNFGIRNGEDTVGDNTKFRETERVRENEYTASYALTSLSSIYQNRNERT
jgi:hypothetical protein